MDCPRCGRGNRPEARFCDNCGQELTAAVAPADAERKQVTVLFADVQGSMGLIENVDPEHWRRVMQRFFDLLREGVERYGGTVDKFTGDGIMALFGAPVAYEDHAERACSSALYLADRLAAYSADLRRNDGLSFSVRIGLNSGEVVAGTIGTDATAAYTAVGHTVGLAQRMEQLAEPGTAYVTEQTAALAARFEMADLGEFRLAGAAQPVRVFRLERPAGAGLRFDAARARGLSELVGREEELAELEAALERALAGSGEVVGVVGEPGVGKSRLCAELAALCAARGLTVTSAHAVAYGQAVPFLAVLELLRAWFGIGEDDTPGEVREKVAGRLLLLDPSFQDDLPLFFDFLGVADPREEPLLIDPEARQRQLLDALRKLSRARSERAPAVIVLEDLHWLDDASAPLLENFVDAARGTRTLIVANFRPEYRARWMSRPHYHELPLRPLPRADAERLAQELIGADPSTVGLTERVLARTAGNPFFTEEVVRALVQTGALEGASGAYRLTRKVDEIAIPPTVEALLAGRIDRLEAPDKALLQRASVIGRQFSEELLGRVAGVEPAFVADTLDRLVASELVSRPASDRRPLYAFRHPLTQEVAYRSQLADSRAAIHRAVAQTLAEAEPDALDELAALVSTHFELGGDQLEAARWAARAATWAGPMHVPEALEFWRRVRWLAAQVTDDGAAEELEMRACAEFLALAWRVTVDDSEAADAFTSGTAIARRRGEQRVRWQLAGAYAQLRGVTGDVAAALAGSREVVLLAPAGDREATVVSRVQLGYWHYLEGDFGASLRSFDEALEAAAGDLDAGRGLYGFSGVVFATTLKGVMLAYRGRVLEGFELMAWAHEAATKRTERELEVWTGMVYGTMAWLAEDPMVAVDYARRAAEQAERSGTAFTRVTAHAALARAYLTVRNWDHALGAGERALALVRSSPTALNVEPLPLTGLAEAHLGRGELELARQRAEEAVVLARKRGTGLYELLAQRALGLVLEGSDDAGARAAFERCAALARAAEARTLEVAALVPLAELAARSGDAHGCREHASAARALLAAIDGSERLLALERRLADAVARTPAGAG